MSANNVPRSPLPSARGVSRPVSASSIKSAHVHSGKSLTLPPMRSDNQHDAKLSTRGVRPASAGGLSPNTSRSAGSSVSARLRQSPYAVPQSSRMSDVKPLPSARKPASHSSRGSEPPRAHAGAHEHTPFVHHNHQPGGSGHSSRELVSHQVHMNPTTPPPEPLTPPDNEVTSPNQVCSGDGRGAVDGSQSYPESETGETTLLDALLETGELEPVIELPDSNSRTEGAMWTESAVKNEELRPEDVPVPETPRSEPLEVQPSTPLPEHDDHSLRLDTETDGHHEDRVEPPQTPAEPASQDETKLPDSTEALLVCESASSVYCGHSTIIGSIPEDVVLPEHPIMEESCSDRAAAPSPAEPSPTPLAESEDMLHHSDRDVLEDSLHRLLTVADDQPRTPPAESPSPILPPLNVSQYSAVTIDDLEKVSTDVQVTSRLFAPPSARERPVTVSEQAGIKKLSVWRKIFCCGSRTV